MLLCILKSGANHEQLSPAEFKRKWARYAGNETSAYNERPAWLAHAHAKLDAAVAAAYGLAADLTDEQILENLSRSICNAQPPKGKAPPPRKSLPRAHAPRKK